MSFPNDASGSAIGMDEAAQEPVNLRAKLQERRKLATDMRNGRVSRYAVQKAAATAAQASKHMTPEWAQAFHDAAMDKAMSSGSTNRKSATGAADRGTRRTAANDADEKLDQVWASLNLDLSSHPRDRCNIRSAMLRGEVVFAQQLLNNFLVKIGRSEEVVQKPKEEEQSSRDD